MVRILIAEQAWEVVCQEVAARFPSETALYPLAALVPDQGCSPLEALRWQAAEAELVITHALRPSPESADFSLFHARFHAEHAQAASADLEQRAVALVQRHPRLAFLTKLHSHPFPGGAFLSDGDIRCNVVRPAARRWWEQRGLAEALLLVVYPATPRTATLPPAGDEVSADGPWALAAFVVTFDGQVARLPDVQVVADADPRVQQALAQPYWGDPVGGAWCDGFKARLRALEPTASRNVLPRGWRRYLWRRPGAPFEVACLPPDWPRAPARVLAVLDARANSFELRRTVVGAQSWNELPTLELLLEQLVGHVPESAAAGPAAPDDPGPEPAPPAPPPTTHQPAPVKP